MTYQGAASYRGELAPKHISTSAVLNEVCKVVPTPTAGAYYPVYVDKPRGGANYCAYHSWGWCNGKAIRLASSSSWMVMRDATRRATSAGNPKG